VLRLIGFLVVISILASLLIRLLREARETSMDAHCKSNAHQWAVILVMYRAGLLPVRSNFHTFRYFRLAISVENLHIIYPPCPFVLIGFATS